MPRYEVEIDLSGTWRDRFFAESSEEAARLAVRAFDDTDLENILACIEPLYPEIGDVEVLLLEENK